MNDPGYSSRAAALLRAAANDLKRDDASAEADLGLRPGEFAELTAGRAQLDWAALTRACQVWPLNERDLLPIHDDCPDGVLVHRLARSRASSRTLDRGGHPYYEYRDTAMSRVASYRPEWIRMLCVVGDDDPDNPAVRWNDGHLLYQFTYFVGPVNYYYRWEGKSYCASMRTGDSTWGLPFAPHSFAARTADEPAYILALTYGGDLVGDAQRELAVLGPRAAAELALRTDPPEAAQAGLLRSYLRARLLTPAVLAARAGLAARQVDDLCAGQRGATPEELAALAAALGVSPRDLLAPVNPTRHGVRLARRDGAPRWTYPDGAEASIVVTQLASSALHPHTCGLELEVRAAAVGAQDWLTTYQHQYLYVLDGGPLTLAWRHHGVEREERLEPGDSAYLLPQVSAGLARPGPAPARVLLLRIGGAAGVDVRFALATMAGGGIDRYLAEDRLWYRAGGPGGPGAAGGDVA